MTKSDVLGMLETAFTRYHTGLPRIYPKRKEVTVTLPTGVTEYTYSDEWITSNTSCYAHDLTRRSVTTTISWTFANGSVTFTLGAALTSELAFTFGMIKGGVG